MFKVIYDGVEIQCETADDAVELAGRLRGSADFTNASSRQGAISGSRWTVSRFQNFSSLLRDKQRIFLQQLISSPDGQTDIALRQRLGLNTNKGFGPILTAISRKAKKIGVDLKEVYTTEKLAHTSGEQVLEFKASPAFIKVAEEAGGIK